MHYECGRNLDNGFLIGTEPENIIKAVWHFGICPEACLTELGLKDRMLTTRALSRVRVPRVPFADRAQAAALYACAGRPQGDAITFERMLAKAEKALPE